MPNLFIVADGMGGHKAGDYASRYTVETIEREIKASFEKNPSIIIQKAIRTANKEIRQRASEDPNLYGMGTTVVVATVIGRYLQVANVETPGYTLQTGRRYARSQEIILW